ncbi:kinase-like protein [Marasmius fiardii PR-910]|nr:kinase-like protein [Marasmius fiardii PR-910]
MYQISEGLKYLHEHHPPIVHNDIKGLNILVSDEEECCIADFGLATIANESSDGQLHVSTSEAVLRGSLPWLAPETMNPDHIGVPSRTARDMYALGCTMYELFTGNPPFSEAKLNEYQIMLKVLSGARPLRPPLCPDWLWSLMQSCWREDFGERPSASEVMSRFRMEDLAGARSVLHGPTRRIPNRRLPDIPGDYSYDPNRLWEGASLQIAWNMFRARIGPKLRTHDYSANLLSD